MSLWAILAAPLLAGNDLSTMTPETVALLTNGCDRGRPGSAGKQGDRVSAEGPIEVWARRLPTGRRRWDLQSASPDADRTCGSSPPRFCPRSQSPRPLVEEEIYLGSIDSPYTVEIPAHGVLFLKLWAI